MQLVLCGSRVGKVGTEILLNGPRRLSGKVGEGEAVKLFVVHMVMGTEHVPMEPVGFGSSCQTEPDCVFCLL